jgi:hypothetical protein
VTGSGSTRAASCSFRPSSAKDKQKPAKFEDALSVFGQFQVDTNADTKNQTAYIELGKFFAASWQPEVWS